MPDHRVPWPALPLLLVYGCCVGDLVGLPDKVEDLEAELEEQREINEQQEAEIEELREVLEGLYDLAQRRSAPRQRDASTTRTSAEPLTARCEQRDDGSYVLDVSGLDNIGALAHEGRVVPNFTDGETDGFKLFAIREDSFYGSCGFRNGDVIRSVSDYPLDGPHEALEAYEALQDADEITVEIERRGKLQEIWIVFDKE